MIALVASFYSIEISKEQQSFQTTQILVGRTFELHLLLQKVHRLRSEENLILQDLLEYLEEHETEIDKDKSGHETYRKLLEFNVKKKNETMDLWDQLINEENTNDIAWLESHIGFFRMQRELLLQTINDRDNHLKRLKERVLFIRKGKKLEGEKPIEGVTNK